MADQREDIEDSIALEQLDVNLYRSLKLWKPAGGIGAFGGQVIAQAVVAATSTVESKFGLHSLHCYFIGFGDAGHSGGILYLVERIRDGRSYATRSVKAVQNGRTIFLLMASFQVAESSPLADFHSPFPSDIQAPEHGFPAEMRFEKHLQSQEISTRAREFMERALKERRQSSTEIVYARDRDEMIKTPAKTMWMRCKTKHTNHARFSKAILAYMSDFELIGTASNAQIGESQDYRLAMLASLDHSMHFYHPTTPNDWVLFDMKADAVGRGRGTVSGHIWTRDGKLVAVVRQEGVVRIEHRDKKAKI